MGGVEGLTQLTEEQLVDRYFALLVLPWISPGFLLEVFSKVVC